MEIPIFQVDAFTERVFGGNPAAVCPLESWLPDETLQGIAWMLLAFFAVALLAYVIVRLSELKRSSVAGTLPSNGVVSGTTAR